MRVKMHQVVYFLALCDERSFTRAAKRCGVAQPSLTSAIKELENECGGRLFDRNKSSVDLTKLGMLVKPDFVRIDQAVADVARKVGNFNAQPPARAQRGARETRMGVVAVAVLTITIIAMGIALRPAPSATAAVTERTSNQVDPYALQSTDEMKTLPEQNAAGLF